MPKLVRHAAVHGFSKEELYEAKLALQDSSVHQRVEEPVTLGSTNAKGCLCKKNSEGADGCLENSGDAMVGEATAS
jgi:hypothetical protein